MKKMILLTFFLINSSLHACSGTWQVPINGSWGTGTNWGTPLCYPGKTLTTDSATFPPNPALTIQLNVSPTLQTLIFNAPSFYTISGSNIITLDGPSPQITVNGGTQEFDAPIQIQTGKTVNISVTSGNLIFSRSGTIFGSPSSSMIVNGPGTMTVQGQNNLVSGNLTIQSGTYNNSNTLPDTLGIGALTDANNIIFSNGSTVNNTNSGVNSGSFGAAINALNALTMNAGTVTNTNSAELDGNAGAIIDAGNSIVINGTAITQLNSGNVFQNGGLGAVILTPLAMTINGAAITTTNTAIVQGVEAFGAVVLGQGSLLVQGGVYNIFNQGPVTGSGKVGSFFATGGPFTMNGGAFTLINSGPVDTLVVNRGLGTLLLGGPTFTMNGGTITLQNSGAISNQNVGSGLGAFIGLAPQSVVVNGGLITINSNTGILTNEGIGSAIIGDSLALNGGTIVDDDYILMNTVTVGPAGTLTGIGVVDDVNQTTGTFLDNQGTIIPGDPVGTLTVNGSYTQESNGTLLIKARSAKAGQWGKLVVNGEVTLAGNLTLQGLPRASFHNGDTIVVVDNSSVTTPITGTFSQFVMKNLPAGVTATVVYKPNQVLITFKVLKVAPPTHLKGVQLKECKCHKVEYINRLTWKASKTRTVVAYQIERNGKKIAKVSAKKPLVYNDANQPNTSAKYKVIAIDKSGLKSKPAVVVVEPFHQTCCRSSSIKHQL